LSERAPALFAMEPEVRPDAEEQVEREVGDESVLLGTSSFTAAGWAGTFYPANLKAREFLRHYSRKLRTVEIDSTFYGTPSEATVAGWNERTPDDFVLCAKVPQLITHEKKLLNCAAEFEEFVARMGALGPKLGPMLLQFPRFGKRDLTQQQFLERLAVLLKSAGLEGARFAVEIRNPEWLDEMLTEVLRERGVALVLTDTTWMPLPWETKPNLDLVTADFIYIRWLGDRQWIEGKTVVWDKTVVDRTKELQSWVSYCKQILRRGVVIYAYANNHFGGHAPATLRLFWELWKK